MSTSRLLLIFVSCLLALPVYSQGEVEALRFGRIFNSPSARISGMAGAGSSLGADLSAAYLNPAGLAQLRRGEFIISPGFHLNSLDIDYIGEASTRNNSQLLLNNLGLAFVSPRYIGYGRNRQRATTGLIQTTVALGYQRQASYGLNTGAVAYNQFSSITDAFAERANGSFPGNLGQVSFSSLAWETFAIDTIAGTQDQYFGSGIGGELEQRIRIRESGNRSSVFASVGLNFDNKIFVGATLMGLNVRHSYRWQFEEEDINGLHNFYQNNPNSTFPLEFPMEYLLARDSIETRGDGVTGIIGVVAVPNEKVRIGVSFQLPGIILMNEIYRREMYHELTFVDQFGQDSVGGIAFASPEAEGSYNLTTPYGFTLGGSYIIGKRGFVTADLEVTDFSSTRLRSPYVEDDPFYYGYEAENERISTLYQPAVNLRVGGEYRQDMIRFRAGVAYEGSPLTEEARTYEDPAAPGESLIADMAGMSFAAGLGIRGEAAFMDLAFQHRQSRDKLNVYATEAPSGFDPTLLRTQATNQVVLTLGVKW
jgi:hypothetical protein